jgi:plasmid stabilization system protein ParE
VRIEFSPEAKAEFEAAERFYERQIPGLGLRFRKEVREAIKRLRHWPLAAPIEHSEIRQLILSRFPYKLLYSVESESIYNLAVAHLHRVPDYWIERHSP